MEERYAALSAMSSVAIGKGHMERAHAAYHFAPSRTSDSIKCLRLGHRKEQQPRQRNDPRTKTIPTTDLVQEEVKNKVFVGLCYLDMPRLKLRSLVHRQNHTPHGLVTFLLLTLIILPQISRETAHEAERYIRTRINTTSTVDTHKTMRRQRSVE
jgi:hypothetical protein